MQVNFLAIAIWCLSVMIAVAADEATLGIKDYVAPWVDPPSEFVAAFGDRRLPQPPARGLLITALGKYHPPELHSSDLLTSIKGVSLTTLAAYRRAMTKLEPGESCRIKLMRCSSSEDGAKWKKLEIDVVPLVAAEVASKEAADEKRMRETVYRFPSQLVTMTGEEILKHNKDVLAQMRRELKNVSPDSVVPLGPNGEHINRGIAYVEMLSQRLQFIDSETWTQDMGRNWDSAVEFMKELMNRPRGISEEDYAVNDFCGRVIVFFEDGTAITIKDMWARLKQRVEQGK